MKASVSYFSENARMPSIRSSIDSWIGSRPATHIDAWLISSKKTASRSLSATANSYCFCMPVSAVVHSILTCGCVGSLVRFSCLMILVETWGTSSCSDSPTKLFRVKTLSKHCLSRMNCCSSWRLYFRTANRNLSH